MKRIHPFSIQTKPKFRTVPSRIVSLFYTHTLQMSKKEQNWVLLIWSTYLYSIISILYWTPTIISRQAIYLYCYLLCYLLDAIRKADFFIVSKMICYCCTCKNVCLKITCAYYFQWLRLPTLELLPLSSMIHILIQCFSRVNTINLPTISREKPKL